MQCREKGDKIALGRLLKVCRRVGKVVRPLGKRKMSPLFMTTHRVAGPAPERVRMSRYIAITRLMIEGLGGRD